MSDEDRAKENATVPAKWCRAVRRTAPGSANRIRTVLLAALLTLACAKAGAGDPNVRLELNKLEVAGNACRAYLLVENASGIGFEVLKLDLVMFDPDGIIADRLAVEAAPLPVGKTSLRVFDIPGLSCPSLGRMLLNDVVSCADAKGSRTDCLGLLSTGTRASVEFIK